MGSLFAMFYVEVRARLRQDHVEYMRGIGGSRVSTRRWANMKVASVQAALVIAEKHLPPDTPKSVARQQHGLAIRESRRLSRGELLFSEHWPSPRKGATKMISS